VLTLWTLAHAAVAFAAGAEWANGAEIRFKLIDGQPCARCTLQGPGKSIPANVVIDLGSRVPLLMHERTAKLLGIAHSSPADLQFDDLTLAKVPVIPTGLRSLEELTADHAEELADIPAVAILGLPALADFTVELEVGNGVLRLLPAGQPPIPAADGPRHAPDTPGDQDATTWSTRYKTEGAGYWLAGVGPEDFALRVRLVTSGWDTVIDSTVADLLGSPGGDLERVLLGGINAARYVALRPEDLSGTPEPHPDLILGTNLLSTFRLTIEPTAETIRFEQIREPRFPVEERAYFVARADEDAGAIESFLNDHPSSRLASEAGTVLLSLRLDEYPPDPGAISRAVRLRAQSVKADRSARTMVEFADELLAGRREDRHALSRDVLLVAKEAAPQALNARVAHEIQARLGLIALQQGDLKQARRHLLSAAFGMPRDPLVSLWLGELYERTGKPARAWSRYLQATLGDDAPPEAFEGLNRLNRDPTFRASFTMADAQQLLEGRTAEFHPPDRYDARSASPDSPSVSLVEFFTCVDQAQTLAPELAFGGLLEFFGSSQVAFIEYHLPAPEPDPLVSAPSASRAAFYGIESGPVVCFDGGRMVTDGGDGSATEGLYLAYKAACLAGPEPARDWRLDGYARISGEEITGRIELLGPQASDALRLHVVLCEQMVMLSGANGVVLHRQVARSALSPEDGYRVSTEPGRRVFEVRCNPAHVAAALERTVTALETERSIQFRMRPTYVDPGLCTIVAFLQDANSRQVLAGRALPVATGREPQP